MHNSQVEITDSIALSLHRYMTETFLLEKRLNILYRNGKISGGLFTGRGNEAVSVGAAMALKDGDTVAPSHRGIGAHLVRGETFKGMLLQVMARAEGGTKGRDNAVHQGSMERGVLSLISHLATLPSVAAGCALAHKMRKRPNAALAFIGEGSSSLGLFHETLNLASVMKLPFVMVIENNQWAYSTPNSKQYACEKLSDRAIGYGIPGITIDGTDVELVFSKTSEALTRAKNGDGPTLIETITMRLDGHSAADAANYVDKTMIQTWEERHPLRLYRQVLKGRRLLSSTDIENLENEINRDIEEAIDYAVAAPEPSADSLLEGVYC